MSLNLLIRALQSADFNHYAWMNKLCPELFSFLPRCPRCQTIVESDVNLESPPVCLLADYVNTLELSKSKSSESNCLMLSLMQ